MLRQFRSPGLIPTFTLGVSRPLSDLILGTWRGFPGNVGANLFSFIDEVVPDDTDYISQGLGNAGSIYTVSLGAPAATVGVTGITIRVRVRRMGGSGAFTFNYDMNRGAFGFSSTGNNPGLAFGTIESVLSAAQVAALLAAIGNLTVSTHGSGGPVVPGLSDAFEVAWIEVEYD